MLNLTTKEVKRQQHQCHFEHLLRHQAIVLHFRVPFIYEPTSASQVAKDLANFTNY
jgi:hypothetical protein